MSKEVSVIILGLLTAAAPFLGLPGSWRTALIVALGVALAAFGFSLRREVLARGMSHSADHFVDNRPSVPGPLVSHEANVSRPRVG